MQIFPVRFLLLAIVLLISSGRMSANRFNFRNYSVSDGLAQSQVSTMVQDERGFIWIATGGGLSRFNGKTFVNYYVENGLPNNRIVALCNSPGHLWIGTAAGLSVFNGQQFETIGKKTRLQNAVIRKLLYADHIVYAITEEEVYIIQEVIPGGVFRVDSLNVGNFSTNPRFSTGALDKKNNLWLACEDEGVYALLWDKSTLLTSEIDKYNIISPTLAGRSTSVIHLSNDSLSVGRNVTAMCFDLAGNLWYTDLSEGVGRIFLNKQQEVVFESPVVTSTGNEFFPKFRYKSIYCDSRGTIWVGSDGSGMVRLQQLATAGPYILTPDYLRRFDSKSGMMSNNLTCFLEDTEHNIWIGSFNGGISRLNGEKFITLSNKENDNLENTLSVFEDSDGLIWNGSYGGGVRCIINEDSSTHYFWEQGICESIVTSITQDNYKSIWCATVGGGISIIPYENRAKSKDAIICLNSENGLPWDFVSTLFRDKNGQIWVGMQTGGGLAMVVPEGPSGPYTVYPLAEEEEVLSQGRTTAIYQDHQLDIWVATTKGLLQFGSDGTLKEVFKADKNFAYGDINCITQDPYNNLWFGTNNNGIWIRKNARLIRYTEKGFADKDEFITVNNSSLSNSIITGFINDKTRIWVLTKLGINRVSFRDDGSIRSIRTYTQQEGLNTVEINNNAGIKDQKGNIWFGTVTGLTCFVEKNDLVNYPPPFLNIEQILLNYNDIHTYANEDGKLKGLEYDSLEGWFGFPSNLRLPYSMNHITLVYSGIQLSAPERIFYQFKLEGFDNDWSPPTKETRAVYSGLEPGEYVFMVKACDADGAWMENAVSFRFQVMAPFYRTWWFYITSGILLFGSIIFFFKWRERNLQAARIKLERLVKERTLETVQQKEEIEHQAELIKAKNHDITSSIEYAKRIQQTILPETDILNNYSNDHFVIYQPRDIVSGDFYWIVEKDNIIYIAAVDCTGHGVPGAFMSLISYNLLNEALAISSTVITDVLENLRLSLYKQLKKYDGQSIIYDGVDIALISYDPRSKTLSATNSNRPIFVIIGNEMTHLKSCKTTIGGVQYSTSEKFDLHQMELKRGDKVYLYSDGYTDQFGGPKNKRLGRASFERLLLEISDLPMSEQREIIHRHYQQWKGDYDQMDDMLVIGIEF